MGAIIHAIFYHDDQSKDAITLKITKIVNFNYNDIPFHPKFNTGNNTSLSLSGAMMMRKC